MTEAANLLKEQAIFDPQGDWEAFTHQIPARWAVVLLADQQMRPVQLLCVKNLRACLRRRLGNEEPIAPSRKTDYRQIVRHILWRRVDSAFEADWIYYEAARLLFPKTYQGMVGFRPAWFLHVDPEAQFPRYVKTIDLSPRPGLLLGPVEDKHAAARLIELIEDCFDLCRYYQILVQAPAGRACAYKEMGKCPAPCDGSISMHQYHRMIDLSISALLDPGDLVRQHTARMQQAAAELRFETAAKIKAYIGQLEQLPTGPYRYVRKLSDFAFVSLQRGSSTGAVQVFLILPGRIQPIATLLPRADRPGDLLRTILALAEEPSSPLDSSAAERIGVVCHHLFASAARSGGVFIPMTELSEPRLSKALAEIRKQKPPPETEGEGVIKELQAME
ncbi:MAG TPA: UvrB/UvrC motif-containing protein [Tepidisphaeraceae bacterium]|nr:UvrB/UvrC motif-containing protein [Tepidisphaeraceae bacterium]